MGEARVRIGTIGTVPRDPVSGRLIQAAADWALFLDVDGTLLPIAETPDAVEVTARLCAALRGAVPAVGRAVALISGRPIADLDRLFAPLRLPTAGLHGLERRDAAGTLHGHAGGVDLEDLRSPLRAFAAAHPGVLLEDKGRGLALHYRLRPEAETAARKMVTGLVAKQPEGLRILYGKMVLEIASTLADKGAAIAAFMGEAPFAGRRPVFVGDDVTDEDGFAVVNAMGGYSIRVGTAAPSAAQYRLEDVAAVVEWLRSLPASLARTGAAE